MARSVLHHSAFCGFGNDEYHRGTIDTPCDVSTSWAVSSFRRLRYSGFNSILLNRC